MHGMKYFLNLLELRFIDIPKRKLKKVESTILKKRKSRFEEMLFNIVRITKESKCCWYIYAHSKDDDIKNYAILKANILYYENITIH